MHFVKADMSYIDVVYEWANDETTRENAFNSAEIPYEDHVRWFGRKIADTGTLFYICKDTNVDIGQLRIELLDGEAIISYSVDKKQRGKGYGKRIIKFAEDIIRENGAFGLKQINLVGKVKHNNIASQCCFRAEGYEEEKLDAYIRFTKVVDVS